MMMGVVLVRDCVVCPRCLLPACLSFLFRPRSIPVVLLCSFCSRPVLLPVFSSRFPVPVFLFVCLLRSSLTPCWCPGYIVRDARPRRMRRDARARRRARRNIEKRNGISTRHDKTSGEQGETAPISNAIAHGQTGKSETHDDTQERYERRNVEQTAKRYGTRRRARRETRRIAKRHIEKRNGIAESRVKRRVYN